MALVRLEDVTKRFGAVTAVDRVTLTVSDGEFFALLGPSGCGKTTTLRLLAGLETPSAGRIYVGERDVTARPPRERDVAMVFQDYALYPHMTILHNVGYPLRVRGVSRGEIARRVGEVAEVLQIGELLLRRPAQLSGGQQQRAAVARAVVHKPQVFLFDEPLSNLDAKLRLEARGFLKHLQHSLRVTTVYVTHDQAEAMALADRIAVMHQGQVQQVGTPLDVYRRPVNTFVASFIGSPPMNLLPCTVGEDGQSLVGPGFRLAAPPRLPLREVFRAGEDAILGVRPEHLAFADGPGPARLQADVYAVQPQGAEYLVTLRVAERLLSVRVFSDEPPVLAARAWVEADMQRALIYRSRGELALG